MAKKKATSKKKKLSVEDLKQLVIEKRDVYIKDKTEKSRQAFLKAREEYVKTVGKN